MLDSGSHESLWVRSVTVCLLSYMVTCCTNEYIFFGGLNVLMLLLLLLLLMLLMLLFSLCLFLLFVLSCCVFVFVGGFARWA